MKYPCLVPQKQCKTPIHVILYSEGLSEEGSPIIVFEADLMCNYQDVAKTVFTADKKLVQLSGIALFSGDICPEQPTLCGGVVNVYGVERTIFQGKKARNPDGSVNFCELRLV